MAKFCTECGKEIAAGVAFCTECGTKAPADPVTETAATAPAVEIKAENPVHTAPAQTYQAQETYTQPKTTPAPPVTDPTNKVIGTGAYFGLMFLFAIPIIGHLACLILAFAPKNKNLKHYARAMLIWMIIGLVITGLLMALISFLTNSVTAVLNEIMDGQLGEALGELTQGTEGINDLFAMANIGGNGVA